MLVGGDHLPQCGSKHTGIGIPLLDLRDHRLKAVDLPLQFFSPRFRALEAQAQLEVLFIAHQNVGAGGKRVERGR